MKYLSEVEGKGGIAAKVVADSVSLHKVRLTTLELKYPRFIHSEFMTHRMFSRNASSSRAIPIDKMIEQVEKHPATPIHWGKNQPGMQAKEEHNEPINLGTDSDPDLYQPSWAWCEVAANVVEYAKKFSEASYHKQVVNRLLEPFQFIHVVVTATEWDNFFDLRLHPDAQPEIHELARVMKEVMSQSTPACATSDYYHTPYVDPLEEDLDSWQDAAKASVARCARVSYKNHDKSDPILERDIELHDKLLKAGHMSPFEHVATPMEVLNIDLFPGSDEVPGIDVKGITHADKNLDLWSGNFRGWIQYRQRL